MDKNHMRFDRDGSPSLVMLFYRIRRHFLGKILNFQKTKKNLKNSVGVYLLEACQEAVRGQNQSFF